MFLHSAILPISLTNSNAGRTVHYGASAGRRKKYAKQLGLLGYKRKPFEHPVDIVVTRILGPNQRLMDSSSLLRGNWKEIEDTLVELGWFVDDSPKYIRATLGLQDSTRRDIGPATLVTIYQAGTIQVVTGDLA
jgi:hypothetical protein